MKAFYALIAAIAFSGATMPAAYGKAPLPAAANDTLYTRDTMLVLVPEFYDIRKLNYGDTTYIIKCYNRHDSLLQSWKSFDEVKFVSVIKNYTDNQHTYKDHGKELPLPVSSIAYRYDKIGTDKWRCINYANHDYSELHEDTRRIVKTDVKMQRLVIQRMMPDVIEVRNMAIIYKYYAVSAGATAGKPVIKKK